MNKKQLYETIMINVSREVKKVLNENYANVSDSRIQKLLDIFSKFKWVHVNYDDDNVYIYIGTNKTWDDFNIRRKIVTDLHDRYFKVLYESSSHYGINGLVIECDLHDDLDMADEMYDTIYGINIHIDQLDTLFDQYNDIDTLIDCMKQCEEKMEDYMSVI